MFDSVYPCVYVYFSVLRVFCLRFGSQQKSSSSTIQQVSRIDMDDSIRVFQDWANVSKTQTFQSKSQVPGKVLRNCCWHRCIPQHFGWLAQFPRPQLSKHSHKNNQLSKTHKKKLPNHSGLKSTTTVDAKKSPHNHSGCSKMLVPKKIPIFPHLLGHGIFVHQPFFGPPNYGTIGLPLRRCRLRCRRLGSSFLLPPALFLLHFVQKIPLLSGKSPDFCSTNALRFWVGHFFFKLLEKMMKIVDLTKKTHGKW